MLRKIAVSLGLFAFLTLSFAQAYAQEFRPRRAAATNAHIQDQTAETNSITVQSAPSEQSVRSPQTNQPRSFVQSGVYSQPSVRAGNALVTDPFVRRTAIAAARPVAATTAATKSPATVKTTAAAAALQGKMLQAMTSWLGTPYRYGSEGPNSIDCSALIWRVFGEAGINFTRTSARAYWNEFPPATEAEKSQFGTLIFFNNLGHVGIVVDENTFFQASTSRGVMFSKIEGYWAKRIVGYRRVPVEQLAQIQNTIE